MIKQYPSNKNIDLSLLSKDQIKIRNKPFKEPIKKVTKKRCNQCGFIQPISNFYYKKAILGSNGYWRRASWSNRCKDCRMKNEGVVEIGKIRFSRDILKKGFRRCSVCKNIKPINCFCKSKNALGGLSNNCTECTSKLNRKYVLQRSNEREKISIRYIIRVGKQKGLKRFNKKTISKLKSEIIAKRQPKYFLDSKSFITMESFAIYVQKKYDIPVSCIVQRIQRGFSEKDCVLSEFEFRSNCQKRRYANKNPKYFLDKKGFVTVSDLCRYVNKKYGISETCFRQRIDKGMNIRQAIKK